MFILFYLYEKTPYDILETYNLYFCNKFFEQNHKNLITKNKYYNTFIQGIFYKKSLYKFLLLSYNNNVRQNNTKNT